MKVWKQVLLGGCVSLLCGRLQAGEANYQPYVIGERAAGMGGAGAATENAMDASYYNPAGLARIQQSSISVNGTLYGVQNRWIDDWAGPGQDLDVSSLATIPAGLSATRKLDEGSVAAFSVFVPSYSSESEILSYPNYEEYYSYSANEQTLMFGPSYGYLVNKDLSVGVSLFGVYQSVDSFYNVYSAPASYSASQNAIYSDWSVLAALGTAYQLSETWRCGLSVMTPSWNLSSSGEMQGNDSQSGRTAWGYTVDNVEADNGLPAQVRAGLGWGIARKYGAALDVIHHFSREYDALSGTVDGVPVKWKRDREAVTDVSAGVEYYVRDCYPIRAGVFTSGSSASELDPNDVSTPARVDLYGVTCSVGSEGEHVVVNLGTSYVFGSGEDFGVQMAEDGTYRSVVVDTKESMLSVFITTAYLF